MKPMPTPDEIAHARDRINALKYWVKSLTIPHTRLSDFPDFLETFQGVEEVLFRVHDAQLEAGTTKAGS